MPRLVANIECHLVFVANGRDTQTVNVCDDSDAVGHYQYKVRLPAPFVSDDEIKDFYSIESLLDWLVKERQGRLETPTAPTLIPSEVAVADHTWIGRAVVAVESSINDFVQSFIAHPYAHRVEHSLHTELFEILKSRTELRGLFGLQDGDLVQLIHKEWPETTARNPTKRGNFDLAILAPAQLSGATRQAYLGGFIAAPIAIEIGLDYGREHLSDDIEKITYSRVPFGYVAHFLREARSDKSIAEIIEHPRAGIKTAYGRVYGGSRFRKLIGEDCIKPVLDS